MHRYRTLSRNLFLVIQSPGEKCGRKSLIGPWLRLVSTTSTNRSDEYKNISDILNVTSNGGKPDSSDEIVAEHEKIREVQSSTNFSGPGGKTRSGLILGIETSADDTGKLRH